MIILGIILAVVGYFTTQILLWIGIILVVVGLILNFVPMGGTRRRVF
jgi:hypothetical protein